MSWQHNALPILTKIKGRDAFPHNLKPHQPKKQSFNHYVLQFTADQQQLWTRVLLPDQPDECGQHLVIDGLHLQTSSHLVLGGVAPLSNIHIVCNAVEFKPHRGGADTAGALYSGELLDYLQAVNVKDSSKFDSAIFDFCCGWNQNTKLCVHTYFERELAECASIFVITLSDRSCVPVHQFHGKRYAALQEIIGIAAAAGYWLYPHAVQRGAALPFTTSTTVYSLFFKVMHLGEVLNKRRGFRNAAAVERWMVNAPAAIPKLVNSFVHKTPKQQREQAAPARRSGYDFDKDKPANKKRKRSVPKRYSIKT